MMNSGETHLRTLLATLSPALLEGEFVYCSFSDARYGDHPELEPIAVVAEAEGLAFVIPRKIADRNGLEYSTALRCITLQVHSSLEAVGLTARISSELAAAGISANILAGHYHDHVLVAASCADLAFARLEALQDG